MYTFTLTLGALLLISSTLLFVIEKLCDRFVFEPIEEDFVDYGEE